MKVLGALVVSIALVGCGGVRTKAEPERNAPFVPSHNGPVCLLAGALPTDVKFTVLGRVKATKRSYGSTDELMGGMADEARRMGADALISLQANQRFKGPMPWRITAPTGIGTAVKLTPESPKFNCLEIGGKAH